MKSLVKIMPKKGVLDPQGKAIENSLKQLGFSQIKEVTQGKIIEIEYILLIFITILSTYKCKLHMINKIIATNL